MDVGKSACDWNSITSRRGKAWHFYIGRLISQRKMRFSTSRPEKPMNILQPNLVGVITSVRYSNALNLVHIGCEMAPIHGGTVVNITVM